MRYKKDKTAARAEWELERLAALEKWELARAAAKRLQLHDALLLAHEIIAGFGCATNGLRAVHFYRGPVTSRGQTSGAMCQFRVDVAIDTEGATTCIQPICKVAEGPTWEAATADLLRRHAKGQLNPLLEKCT